MSPNTPTGGAARLPDGTTTTRRRATEMLAAGAISHYLTAHDGQAMTVARQLGVSITCRRIGSGVHEVRLGAPRYTRRQSSSIDSIIDELSPSERDAVRRVLRHVLSRVGGQET